ncbi:MAG: hypothetical protein LBV74_02005 [Tannerella sp.]|jgi:hypothetical protein|nr:hypothetical protein [Tannerella sp.]
MIFAINRLYRILFCRGGHGVHSPFVFDLITNVIEEKRLYYCYERLNAVRLQLLQDNREITFGNRKLTIRKMLNRNCFTEREHRFLFRLANRFQPKTIYVAGSDFGLNPLYLTAYSKKSSCTVFEPELSVADIAHEFINKYALASIDICNRMADIPDHIDLIVWGNSFTGTSFSMQAFDRILTNVNDESVMVFSGINASPENRKTWDAICQHSEVTVSLDLYNLGVVFFNPKLHRKTYKNIIF